MRVNRIFLAINLITLLLSFFFVQVAIANDASQSDAFNPRPDRAAIFIYRNEFIGMLYDMEVHINGEQIKPLPSFKYIRLDVAAGTYNIGSPLSLNITVEAGKRYFVWRKIGWGSQVYFVSVAEERGLKDIKSCKFFAQMDIGEVPIAVASSTTQSEAEQAQSVAYGGYDPSNQTATTGFDANNTTPMDVIVNGTYKYSNGSSYEGDMLNGNPNGWGKITFSNGAKYEGSVLRGSPNGAGTFMYLGDRFEGNFVNGKLNGRGVQYSHLGSKYDGEWKSWKKDGQGIFYFANGNSVAGIFKDNLPIGAVTYRVKDGRSFQGMLMNEIPHNGVVYSANGVAIGKIVDGKEYSFLKQAPTAQSNASVGTFFQGLADVINTLAPVIEGVQESRQRRSGYSNAQFERDMQALQSTQSNQQSQAKRSENNGSSPVTNDNLELNSNKTKSFEARDRYDPSIKYEGSTDRFGGTTVREKYDPTATKYKGDLDKSGEGKLKDYNGNELELKN